MKCNVSHEGKPKPCSPNTASCIRDLLVLPGVAAARRSWPILLQNLPEMSPRLAEQTYTELLDPREGFFRKGESASTGLGPSSPCAAAPQSREKN